MSNASIYDRAEALQRLDSDETLLATVAQLFIDEHDNYCTGLERALAAGDAAALRREAHSAKSMLATFSYAAGQALAFELETQAAAGDLSSAATLTPRVIAAIHQLVAVLRDDFGGSGG